MRTRGLLAALALPLLLVGACGGDGGVSAADPAPTTSSAAAEEGSAEEGSASASPDDVTGPQCSEVWVAGAQLPGGYRGCYDDTERVRAGGRYCEFGKPLLTYADRFYAVRGGRIAEAAKPFASDPGYQDVLAKCSG